MLFWRGSLVAAPDRQRIAYDYLIRSIAAAEGVHRSVTKDLVEWTMTVTSPDGIVVLELSAKQTRRKP